MVAFVFPEGLVLQCLCADFVRKMMTCPYLEDQGPGDLVSKVISPLIGVISHYKYSYLIYNPSY